MFCKNCGKDLFAEDKLCPNCGTAVQNENIDIHFPSNGNENPGQEQEVSWLYAILALVFGVFFIPLGPAFGFLGLSRYKKHRDTVQRVMCVSGIALYVFWTVLVVIQIISFIYIFIYILKKICDALRVAFGRF